MDLIAFFHAQDHDMPRLPVVQRAGQAHPLQAGDRGGEAVQQLAAKVVETLWVLFDAEQPALHLAASLGCLGIAHTDDQQATLAVRECAHGFVHPVLLAADPLEVEAAAFGRGEQGLYAFFSLGGGDFDHGQRSILPVPG
nr:hypothetical protein [Pseudacidovorax sp. NFM-22]